MLNNITVIADKLKKQNDLIKLHIVSHLQLPRDIVTIYHTI